MKTFQGVSLADEILAATYHPEKRIDSADMNPAALRKVGAQIRAGLIGAKRYMITEDVVRAATRLGVQHPDILAAMLTRARLPFPKVWVEWDQRAAIDELGQQIDENSPPLSGALIEDIAGPNEPPLYRASEMSLLSDETRLLQVNPTAFIYSLDRPVLQRMPLYQERSEISRISGFSKEVLDRCLLGAAYNDDASKWLRMSGFSPEGAASDEAIEHRLEICRKLADHATHTWSPFWPSYSWMVANPRHGAIESVIKSSIVEFAGTWRFLISLFALIQNRDFVSFVHPPSNPAKRRFVGNKVVPYLQHWRVKLNLPREVVLRKAIASVREYLPRPRHEVEGHWAVSHIHGDPNCLHVEVSETATRYRCALCGRARWWRKPHERGSAEIGFVTKDRVVDRRTKEGSKRHAEEAG